MHLYSCSIWQSPTGRWHCNDVKDLAGISGKWWIPARMLELSLVDYIFLLKDEFKADIESYYEATDCLLFSWKHYSDCNKYVSWINSQARKVNFMI